MALSLRFTAHSEIGLVRKNNQDSGYASSTMLMVADGMGGAAAGDLASAVAIRQFQKADETLHAQGLSAPHDQELLRVLADAAERTNERIASLSEADPGLEGMGTTVCGAIFTGSALAMVNIGDSRAYRWRDGTLERLTHDHSWIQTLVDEGRISEAEALVHPHRSLILKVLNGQPNHHPDLMMTPVQAGDRLLFCSDGLCGLVVDADIAAEIGAETHEEALKGLIRIAHAAGGLDNITILLADVVEGDPEGSPTVVGAAEELNIPELDEAIPDPEARVPHDPEQVELDRYALTARRRPGLILKIALAILIPVLALAGGGWWWYSLTQSQYYVGTYDSSIAIYKGVPDKIGAFALSRVLETYTTQVSDLPPFFQERVRANIKVPDLPAAHNAVAELRQKADLCVQQRLARAQATTSPTATPAPTATPSASPGASPTPSISLAPAPEDC